MLMTQEEREKFYDDEIAPALLALSKRCNEAGLSFLAGVEWAPGESGTTVHFVPEHGGQLDRAYVALRAGNNVDSLIMHIMKQAGQTGHSSMCLTLLGVPHSPNGSEDG
ncbi:hypothetical protein [Sphingobium aquiterrae]|uniref:hypothetical protein n=1 Tax=Sphingobium aquiterrae TaxID=2038656 RepID=UPI003019F6F7